MKRQILMGAAKTLLGVACVMTTPTSVGADPVELLLNRSFEEPVVATWGPAPTNWTIGPPEPAAVNYEWLQPQPGWGLNGDNPDGDQIAVLFGNCRQTVGVLEADKLYHFRFSVYFRSNEQFYADVTTTPWSGGMLRFINDPGAGILQNLPDPLPLNEWIDLTGTLNTSLPIYESFIGQTFYVHFWSTGTANEILLDDVSLLVEDAPPTLPPTYYFSSSVGNDANDGLSAETAWQSFSNIGAISLGPGSAVKLKRGDMWPNSKLTLSGKGTADDPIRLTAYGEGPNPIITGINDVNEPAVVINNPSHWEIDSLDLREAKVGLYLRYTGGNFDGTGPMFHNENISISHMHFQDIDHHWNDENGGITVTPPYELSWGSGIWVGGSVPAFDPNFPSVTTRVLDGLSVRHSSFQNVQTGIGNGWYFPPQYKGRMTNVLLEDCWVTGCSNGSFALFSMTGGIVRRVDTWLGGEMWSQSGTTAAFLQDVADFLIEDCEFAFNKRNNTGADGTGMDFEGNTSNVTFRHNVMHNNDGSGLLVLPTNGNNQNLQMLSNTLWNNARNPPTTGQNAEARSSNNSHTGLFSNNGIYLGTNINPPGGLSVYNNTTTWNNRFSANTGGNRTTTSWASVSSRPTAWNFSSGVQGWGGANDWGGFGVQGGALVGTSTGNDPYVESAPTWVNTRERRWVLVTMSQTVGEAAQVFFQTETEATWTEDKSAWFPIIPDGVMRSYAVDLGQSAKYRGVVTRYRLDPTTEAGSQMAIAEFGARLDPYLKSAVALSTNEIEVRFNQAMLPGGGVFDAANYAISGAGSGSLATNPSTVTQIPTDEGPVYRLRWHEGSANGAPATITVSNAQAARGHAISPMNSATFETIGVPVNVSEWFYVD